MNRFRFKISLMTLVVMMMQTSLHSQCTDTSVGNLDAKNLRYSPSDIYSCSKVTVTAEWDVESQWSYDANFHLSKLIVSLPNEFVGTSGSYTITSSDGEVYWDPSSASLLDAEFQVNLRGLIPAATNLSIVIKDMDVDLNGAFALFNVSQSISTVIADCIPQKDEHSLSGVVSATEGPMIENIVSNCTATEVGLNLTVSPELVGGAIVSTEWVGPGGFTSTEEDPRFSIDASEQATYTGTYTVTVTDAKGCTSVGSIVLDEINCLILPVK